ncbi:hypothetical protein BST61_g103 [Cercospora zeina]
MTKDSRHGNRTSGHATVLKVSSRCARPHIQSLYMHLCRFVKPASASALQSDATNGYPLLPTRVYFHAYINPSDLRSWSNFSTMTPGPAAAATHSHNSRRIAGNRGDGHA